MTNRRIEDIYGLGAAALKNGQSYVPVHIFPFKMEDEIMDEYTEHRWYDFWIELKEGYDYFEAEERPPLIKVVNGKYTVLEAEE
jgi:murein L,D-transpeptidase YafK